MKKYYEEPDFKEIIFEVSDVIMTSGEYGNEIIETPGEDEWEGSF